jgi:hypothetical protein
MGIVCCEFPIFLENDFSNILRKKEIRDLAQFSKLFCTELCVLGGGIFHEFSTVFGQFSKLLLLVIIKSFLECSLMMLYQKFEKKHIEI